jgi:hypothetical protein
VAPDDVTASAPEASGDDDPGQLEPPATAGSGELTPASAEIADLETLRSASAWSWWELLLLLVLFSAIAAVYGVLAIALIEETAAPASPRVHVYLSIQDTAGAPVLSSLTPLDPETAAAKGLVSRRRAKEIERGKVSLAGLALVPPTREERIAFIREESAKRAASARGQFGSIEDGSADRLIGLAAGLLLASWLVLLGLIPSFRALRKRVPAKFLFKYLLLSGALLLVCALLFSGALLLLRSGIEFLKFLTDPVKMVHEVSALQVGAHAEAIVDMGDAVAEHSLRELANEEPMAALLRNGDVISMDLQPLVNVARGLTWINKVLSLVPGLITLIVALAFSWRLRKPMGEIARLPQDVSRTGERSQTHVVLLSAGVRFCWEIVLAVLLWCLVLGAGAITGFALRATLAPAVGSSLDLTLVSMNYLMATQGAYVSLVYVGLLASSTLMACGLVLPLVAMMLWAGKTQQVARLVVADRTPLGRFKRYLLLAPLAAAWLQLGPLLVALGCASLTAWLVRTASPAAALGLASLAVLVGLVLWAWPGRGVRALDYLLRTKLAPDPDAPSSSLSSAGLLLRLAVCALIVLLVVVGAVWGISSAIRAQSEARADAALQASALPPAPVIALESVRLESLERLLRLEIAPCALSAVRAEREGATPRKCKHQDHREIVAECVASFVSAESDFDLALSGPLPIREGWRLEIQRTKGLARFLLMNTLLEPEGHPFHAWSAIDHLVRFLSCFKRAGWNEAWLRGFMGSRIFERAGDQLVKSKPSAEQREALLGLLRDLDTPHKDVDDALAWLRDSGELLPANAMDDPSKAPLELQAVLEVYAKLGPVGRAHFSRERTAAFEHLRALADELARTQGEALGVTPPAPAGETAFLRWSQDVCALRRLLLNARARNRLLRVALDPKAPLPKDPWGRAGEILHVESQLRSSRGYDGKLGTSDDLVLNLR